MSLTIRIAWRVLHSVWCAHSTKFCWYSPAGMKVIFTPSLLSSMARVSTAPLDLPIHDSQQYSIQHINICIQYYISTWHLTNTTCGNQSRALSSMKVDDRLTHFVLSVVQQAHQILVILSRLQLSRQLTLPAAVTLNTFDKGAGWSTHWPLPTQTTYPYGRLNPSSHIQCERGMVRLIANLCSSPFLLQGWIVTN